MSQSKKLPYRILRPTELAQMLGVSMPTLWRWNREGKLPPKVTLGENSVGWKSTDIEAWIEQRTETKGEAV